MMSKKNFISVSKSACVITQGNPELASNLWIVLHGYGQLAENFQKNFQNFDESHYFVFPNALNNFYLKSGRGEVGSSWMTKYEREKDIEDNNNYLNQVYEKFIKPYYFGEKNFMALGFSQGSATLIRWLAMNNIKVDKLIVWGAVFPPDMNQMNYLKKLKQLEWLYFVGTHDEFISAEEKELQKNFFTENNFNLRWIEYEGKHALMSEVLSVYI